MTSFRTNRGQSSHLSTGPVTEEGKKRSRQNALRHGLTAETVIGALEDAEDYAAFEMAVTADYDAQSAVERELVLRLASLLWRLRRATAIESGLFKIQAKSYFNSGNADRLIKSTRISSKACTKMRWRPRTTYSRKRAGILGRCRLRTLLINPAISHAPLSASQTCRPTRLTG
jgi:hypothetical protein